MPFDMFKEIAEVTGSINVKFKYDTSGNIICETTTWKGKFEYYSIIVREAKYTDKSRKYYLEITGSLHKNHQKGSNFKRFSFLDCCKEIKHLCDSLQLDSKQVQIVNLEFGVNIRVDFAPYEYIENHLISYKCNKFDRYKRGKKKKHLGYYCEMEEYIVKLYDKGLQNGLQYHLMRFEYRIREMHNYIKSTGIRTLYDLMDVDLVSKLIDILLSAWDKVFLYEEIDVTGIKLTPTLKKILPKADNVRYWDKLHETNARMYGDYRRIYLKFIKTHGTNNHIIIRAKIVSEWSCLVGNVSSNFGVMVKSENRRSINSKDRIEKTTKNIFGLKPSNNLLTKCTN